MIFHWLHQTKFWVFLKLITTILTLKNQFGVGAYRDNSGKPIIFPSVKKLKKFYWVKKLKRNILPLLVPKFPINCENFIFNNSNKDANGKQLIDDGRIVTAQTISGTGSLRVIADFLNRFYSNKKILVPKPTWANHVAVFKDAGLEPEFYSYYETSKNDLDYSNLKNL